MNTRQAPRLFMNVHKIVITVFILGTPLLSNAMLRESTATLPEQLVTCSLPVPELVGMWRAALDQAEKDQKNEKDRFPSELAHLSTHFQATKADTGWSILKKDSQKFPSFDAVTELSTQAIINLTAFSVVKKWNPEIKSVDINVHLTRETCTPESREDYKRKFVWLLETPGVDAHGVIDLTSKDDPQHGWEGGGLSIQGEPKIIMSTSESRDDYIRKLTCLLEAFGVDAHGVSDLMSKDDPRWQGRSLSIASFREAPKIINIDDFYEKVVMWGGKHPFAFGLMKPKEGNLSFGVRRDRLIFDVTASK